MRRLLLCLFESCSALTCRARNLEVSPACRAPACWCSSSAPPRKSLDLSLLKETFINAMMSRLAPELDLLSAGIYLKDNTGANFTQRLSSLKKNLKIEAS